MATNDPTTTYAGTLYTALKDLVEAVEFAATMPVGADLAMRYMYSPQWALEAARAALALDQQGMQAAREQAIQNNIPRTVYLFADTLHDVVLGSPRRPGARRHSVKDLQAALETLERLTQASFSAGGDHG